MYTWDQSIKYVKGVGPQRAKALARLGIKTVGDLLDYHPPSYIYGTVTPIANVAKEGHAIIQGKIKSLHRLPTRIPIIEAVIADETGEIKCRWYNFFPRFMAGMKLTMWGKYSKGALQQPKFSTIEPDWDSIAGGQYGTHSNTIRAALKEVLDNIDLPDLWEGSSRTMVYGMFHFPETKDEQKTAEYYLKFDEMTQLMWAMEQVRDRQTRKRGVVIPGSDQTDQYMPFEPTDEQCQAMGEISNDLASGHTMTRLLHGEVASGKSLVAFYAAMLTALAGKRALILCPTTILSQQHYDTLRRMGWEDVSLWENRLEPDNGRLPSIIISTHCVLSRSDILQRCSLVIIDEFHKFGVEQRAQACRYNPHLLLISATPIPRSLAMTVFADLDISVIKEQPIERGTVITRWVIC